MSNLFKGERLYTEAETLAAIRRALEGALVKRLRELRNNQYADPSTAPEFVFLDPDLPPSEWQKQYNMDVVYVRADRIEQLVATNEALTEQLEAARLDAKEAEAYSVWLEGKLAKATKALKNVRDFVRDLEPYADQGHTLAPALHDACVILNELKGSKHD
jgi:hypothetical protein